MLDPEKMTNFIRNYFKNEEIKAVINKLSDTADVQLVFVESFITESEAPNRVDEDIIEIFVKLLAESGEKEKKKRILPELKKLGKFPIKCSEICLKHNIKDAAAFLEEMRGNREGLKTAIDLRFQVLNQGRLWINE